MFRWYGALTKIFALSHLWIEDKITHIVKYSSADDLIIGT